MPDPHPPESTAARERRLRFEAVALPFMQPLYNTALRISGARDDAMDLVQETYLRAFRTFDNFRAGTNCKAWLFTIMYSVFINRWRKAQREVGPLPVEELEERFPEVAADWPVPGPTDAQEGDLEWSAQVEEALRDLPEAFRSAVLLVDVQELSYEEAAAALGCPIGTLRSRLFRARRILAVRLAEHARRMGFLNPEDR